jgi:hypothetical protein
MGEDTIAKGATLLAAINEHLDKCKEPECHVRTAVEKASGKL